MADTMGRDDMTEHTGGHYLHTAAGLTPLDPAVPEMSPWERSSLEAYMEHSRDCLECRRQLFNCPDGAQLWDTYQAARHSE
jgi:hypothetical protein